MKFCLLLGLCLSTLSAQAIEGYCHESARQAAVNEAIYEFPGALLGAAQTEVTEYSGHHQKEYIVTVNFKTTEPSQTYMVLVHEFETPETDCVVDQVENVTIEE